MVSPPPPPTAIASAKLIRLIHRRTPCMSPFAARLPDLVG